MVTVEADVFKELTTVEVVVKPVLGFDIPIVVEVAAS
jgi:hypothetical protein